MNTTVTSAAAIATATLAVPALGGMELITFDPPAYYSTGNGTHDLAIGDIDGDGDLDLVAANHWAPSISALKNDGNGHFSFSGSWPSVNGVQTVALGDLDADGDLDVASVGEYSQNQVSVRLNNGFGSFGSQTLYSTGDGPRCVAFGDVNDDGFDDLITANRDDASMSCFLSNGDGTLQPQVSYFLGGAPHGQMELIDMNEDDMLDVVNVSWGADQVIIHYNQGGGVFSAPNFHPVGNMPFDLAVADFDEDGHLDITTANFWTGDVSVIFGDGKGSFTTDESPIDVATSNIEGVVADDFNGDGHADIVVINGLWSLIHVIHGNGDGTFMEPIDDQGGSMQRAIVAADFDTDGDLDLAVAHLAGDVAGMRKNTTPVTQFTTGDLDEDGDIDFSDLLDLLSQWGETSTSADLDQSGAVGFEDLLILLSNWT